MATGTVTKSDMLNLNVFQQPQCIIETDRNGHLVLKQETEDELKKIDLPLNVIAITGLYRTGKSYLMNRLANHTSGFALGNSIQSKTKGIWIWCKIHPTQKDQVLVLLDTEGLGDVEKGSSDHDNKLFLLATLLSSTLVYNMMTAFNQDAIEKLTFITEMSKNLMISTSDKSDDNFDLLMPEFVLCIRDFALDLAINGGKCSEDEYLENCLKEKTGKTTADQKYNRPRQCIKKYFTKRKTFTFDRPASREILKNLDQVTDKDLSPDFIMETTKFKSYVYVRQPKTLQNKRPVTGSMLAELITVYVKAMKDGKVPCIDDAVTVMSKAENERRAGAAIAEYIEELEKLESPVPNKTLLLTKCTNHQTRILSSLNAALLFDDDHKVENSTKADMEKLYRDFEDKNSKLLYEKCLKELTKLHDEDIKGKLDKKKYMVAGGYELYKSDMTSLLEKYTNQLYGQNVDSMEIQTAKRDFLAMKTSDSEVVMNADKTISAKEKEEEMKRREKEIKHNFEEIQKREIERLKNELDRQKKCHENKMEKVREAQEKTDKKNMEAYIEEKLGQRDTLIHNLTQEIQKLKAASDSSDSDSCLLI